MRAASRSSRRSPDLIDGDVRYNQQHGGHYRKDPPDRNARVPLRLSHAGHGALTDAKNMTSRTPAMMPSTRPVVAMPR